jgi:O-antigen/teichoic acid export membrane protein
MKRANPFARYGAFAFSVGGGRIAGLLITSATFPYIVRHLGVEIYGRWSYVLAVCAFLGIFANPGLVSYATQQVAARREAAFDIIPDVLALRLIGSLVAGGLLVVVVSFETRPDARELFYLYGIGALLMNLTSADYLLGAMELFHANSLLTVVQQGLYAIGVFRLVHSPKDILWLPGSILMSASATNLAGWFILSRRGFRMRWTMQPSRWREILVPSSHYAVSSLMSNLYTRTGHIMVRWFLGEYAIGLYAAAARLVDISRHFVLIVLTVLMPRMALAAKSEAGLGRLARFAFGIIAAMSIPLTVGLVATAHLIVPWLMGVKYMGAIPLLRWMAPYIITASIASLLSGTILYAMGQHRAYMASTCGGAVAGVLLYLVLITTMGLAGACLAFVLAEVIVAGIAYFLIPRELRSLWKDRLVGYAVLSSFGMLIAIRIVDTYTSNPMAVISVGGLVYVILSFWSWKQWLVVQTQSPS